MRVLPKFFCSLVFMIGASVVWAETWRSTDGQSIEGRLSGVFGSVAIVSGTRGTGIIPLNRLDDAGLARVATYLDTSPKERPLWAHSSGRIAASLQKHLQILQGGKLVAFDPGTRPEPEIFLVYFGAHWCPPCRAFSPKLVEWYRRMKEEEPSLFDLVFVSDDRSQDEQLAYVQGLGMPWPILKYTAIGSVPAVEQSAGPVIPNLVVLTRDGEMIFSSFHGAEYVGPEFVLGQLEPLLRAMDENSLSCRWALHRLAVLQFTRDAGGKTIGPKPYMIALDRSRYQTLQTKKVNVLLDIDDHGQVTRARADPELPLALEYFLEQDARGWLFLPAVANGLPMPTRAIVPVVF